MISIAHDAEAIAARGISLPSFPGITDAEQDRVADALAEALRTAYASSSVG